MTGCDLHGAQADVLRALEELRTSVMHAGETTKCCESSATRHALFTRRLIPCCERKRKDVIGCPAVLQANEPAFYTAVAFIVLTVASHLFP